MEVARPEDGERLLADAGDDLADPDAALVDHVELPAGGALGGEDRALGVAAQQADHEDLREIVVVQLDDPTSIDALAPGHGTVIPDAQAEIARVIAHRLGREAKVIAALAARGRATVDELLPSVYDDVPVALHGWARHSLLAHAIKLVEEGRAISSDGTYEWRG